MVIYDCIVVGGGPAGAASAYFLARRGRRVLLLEKQALPRYKCCAGGVPVKAKKVFEFDLSPCWEREITGAVFTRLSRERVAVDCDQVLGWVTRREVFDDFLVERAREAGAEILTETEFRSLEERPGEVLVRTLREKFRGRVLIGADGPRSRVADQISLNRRRLVGFALEVRVPISPAELSKRGHFLNFDFGRLRGGYGWIFPRRDHLSVGVGTRHRVVGLKEDLLCYLEAEGLGEAARKIPVRGEFLSCCRYPPVLVKNRCLLAGAAAGLTDLLTGEGIYQALISGKLAARAADDFLEKGRSLDVYTGMIRKKLGRDLLRSGLLSDLRNILPGRLSPRLLRYPRLLRRAMLKTSRG